MKKKYVQILLSLCGLVLVAGLSAWITLYYQKRGTISIKNQTHKPIHDVYVIYYSQGVEQKSWIGTLSAQSEYQYRINYDNIYEGNMRVVYQQKSIDVGGYIANYDKRHYVVEIE